MQQPAVETSREWSASATPEITPGKPAKRRLAVDPFIGRPGSRGNPDGIGGDGSGAKALAGGGSG